MKIHRQSAMLGWLHERLTEVDVVILVISRLGDGTESLDVQGLALNGVRVSEEAAVGWAVGAGGLVHGNLHHLLHAKHA